MSARRFQNLPILLSTKTRLMHVNRNALLAIKTLTGGHVFIRNSSSSKYVSVKSWDPDNPITLYGQPSRIDPLSFGGITEEMLEKQNRTSSSIGGDGERTFTREEIKGLNRKQLQKICKAIGTGQAAKSAILVEKIIEFMDKGNLPVLAFYPFCNMSRPNTVVPGDVDLLSIDLNSHYLASYGRIYERRYPSVTTVIKKTRSEVDAEKLRNWEKKETKRLGKEKFESTVKNTLNNGHNLHKVVAEWLEEAHEIETEHRETFQHDLGLLHTNSSSKSFREDFFKNKLIHAEQTYENPLLCKQLKSILPVLVSLEFVTAIESGVVNHSLGYAGTFDCIAVYQEQLCIFDWKTSKKKRKSLKSCHDYPIQLAAYAGAVNHDPAYMFGIESAAIVFAYDDGSTADVHRLTCNQCEEFWDQWQSRLQVFRNSCEIPPTEEDERRYNEIIEDTTKTGNDEPRRYNDIIEDTTKMGDDEPIHDAVVRTSAMVQSTPENEAFKTVCHEQVCGVEAKTIITPLVKNEADNTGVSKKEEAFIFNSKLESADIDMTVIEAPLRQVNDAIIEAASRSSYYNTLNLQEEDLSGSKSLNSDCKGLQKQERAVTKDSPVMDGYTLMHMASTGLKINKSDVVMFTVWFMKERLKSIKQFIVKQWLSLEENHKTAF
eukprot:gene370-1003_t